MVKDSPDHAAQRPGQPPARHRRLILAVVTIGATSVFLAAKSLDDLAGRGTAPEYLGLVLILPPATALALVHRATRVAGSDSLLRGQYTAVAAIFGVCCVIGVVASAVGDLARWQLPLWTIGVLCGTTTVILLRRRSDDAS